MKATKIELQCYNSNVVNKYSVQMPSGVAEYFFDFAKKDQMVTRRGTITKNGNKCVFTLSFDTADAATMTVTADTDAAADAYQAGEYQEEEAEMCNIAAEEAEKLKKLIESIKQTAEEKAAADKVEEAEICNNAAEEAEKHKNDMQAAEAAADNNTEKFNIFSRLVTSQLVKKETYKDLISKQKFTNAPKNIKELIQTNKGSLMQINSNQERAIFAIFCYIQEHEYDKFRNYINKLSAYSLEQMTELDDNVLKETLPPSFDLNLLEAAKIMYNAQKVNTKDAQTFGRLILSLVRQPQIIETEKRYTIVNLVESVSINKAQNNKTNILSIRFGWVLYYNLHHNFAQGINKYLSITNDRKLNTAETQYLFNLWASNTGNNKITKKTQSIINDVNKQKHPQVCKESIKKTLQQFKQHGMISDYILSDNETIFRYKDKAPKKVNSRRNDK